MNNKISFWLEKYLQPVGAKLAANKPLNSIRDGIALSMPLVIVGSMALLIANGFSIDPFKNWLMTTGIFDWLVKIINASFGLMGLVAAFGIAYRYAESHGTDALSAGILSLASFFLVTPDLITSGSTPQTGISYTYLGASGLFAAILIALISTAIFNWFVKRNIQIKMPDGVPPAVSNSFAALIPGAVILIFWGLVYAGFKMTSFENIHQVLQVILGKPLGAFGGSLAGAIIVSFITSLLWFIGIHGGNITGAIMSPIWLALMGENLKIYQNNPSATMPHIVTQPFMDFFVYMGGGGATLGLVLAIWLIAKSSRYKTLKTLITPPGLFNINEPTMFGIPIVLNVSLLIPFILAPILNAIITYITMATGIVHATVGVVVPWVTPPIISGFLATGSHISGSILQIVLIILDIIIYLPFVKNIDRLELKNEQAN
ncbi:PTS cellobiose transporter subunit IIC [Leuconostoc gasicomitatum]|uniref:PTS cellobiose transporter subunit IIC n=1 Tax=Leuconostoc gelidum group TaxID=3016637 RepID=UPI0007DF0F56|nr:MULTISPECIES: PTS cellobiose transporter subunit IIC [Leuconostoc gelidum group]MBZ5944978.1 PTS cellobiose transporter subunit IIC [Leuconostoc gasicomitatum]MBZ5948624.1 PTS cellobiose transporter subunit IIC [Leuconostoc gasicomitatum]MBZ5948999.1 PTS cellobiose transporter subunit IIC [Leuconostoc gasicomitatum]MBZ5951019.1 PTS cellobiose transporter subunit IIC [Leuconostoc gasicomitatum]MBZ5961303.1 PTS cellobiose transporter subunit IIC [Leuconostoc gasicomitatum]